MNKNNSLQANSEERIKFIEILDSLKNSGIIEYDKEDKSVFYPSKNFVSTFLEIVAERIEKNLEEGISKSQINTKKLLMISVIEATSHYKKKVTLDEILVVDYLIKPSWEIIKNTFFKEEIIQRILNLLKKEQKAMDAQEISAALNIDVTKIYVPLRRLLKRKQISNPSRGTYQSKN